MKKIGILTFHWATNYGAVLQAFATARFLEEAGYEAEIINYRPRIALLKQAFRRIKAKDKLSKKREGEIEKFRRAHLPLSSKEYKNFRALSRIKDGYSALISGSDQVWNESFTLRGELRPTLSYFLPFGGECKRIAYAVSFGSDTVSFEYKKVVGEVIRGFDAVSVRENTGLSILSEMGVTAVRVPDPTALLSRLEYDALADSVSLKTPRVFSYFLRTGAEKERKVRALVREKLGVKDDVEMPLVYGLCEWLAAIKGAECVVTNSFHGSMLSIIFKTPFVFLSSGKSKMNDRLSTLLGSLGLSSRIAETEEDIERVLTLPIDWNSVSERLSDYSREGREFLLGSLEDI